MRLHALVSDLETARRAAEGGVTVIQLRLKGATTEEVVARGAGFRGLGPTFTLSEARQALGTTRRVAVPLLEHLARTGRTIRVDELTHRLR